MIRRMLLPLTYALALALLVVPRLLFGQDVEPAPDLKAVAVDAINALIAPLTLVVLWGLKTLWKKIPASLVLFLGPAVGVAINFGLSYLGNHPPADPVVAALLGAVSTWAREFLDTVISKGFTGPVTLTKLNF